MAITIKLKNRPSPLEEQWLVKNIGPRMHYMHNSIGGQGWIANMGWTPELTGRQWRLTLDDERYASFFLIMFPQ
jgi:hypothetical protein